MSKKKSFLFLIFFLIFLITGCTNENKNFQNFTNSFFTYEVCSSTINLHYSLKEPEQYKITDIPITFGTFDRDKIAYQAYLENLSFSLSTFPYHKLSKENQLTYDVLSYYFETAKTGLAYDFYEEPLSPVTGIHMQLPILLAEYEFRTFEDIETYLALLKTLPKYFESLIRYEQRKSEAGLFMSEEIAQEVIRECNAFLNMKEENYLFSTFEEKAKSIRGEKYVLQNKDIVYKYVFPAYKNLITVLAQLANSYTNTKGLCYFPKGKAYYSYLAKSNTGSNRTVEEMQTLIESQIADDVLALQKIVNSNSDLPNQSCSINQSPEQILETLQNEIKSSFPPSKEVPVEVKKVPASLEEHLSPAFYLIPPIDDYSKNTIYINSGYSMEDISLFTTLAHEGYPGHLYQTTYYASTNPDPIRLWLNFNGYVEGWATYAEMCSYYISPLEKPLATLMQKNNSIILGLYAAADIGIHYEGWNLEKTVDFFSTYGIEDENVIKEIYQMILGDPANYLSYYVGYVEILELKKEFEGTQMEFHQKLLEIGPAPFSIIKEYLEK